MINVVIPMAGEGARFRDAGYENPKPFIDVNGDPMIRKVQQNLFYPDAHYYFLARTEHMEQEKARIEELTSLGNVSFIAVDQLTEGTACTVLYAREFIDNERPLVIANSDQIIDVSFAEFVNDCIGRDLDGSIMTFIDPEENPKWSFARIDENQHVVEVREKEVISQFATVGIYMFSQGQDFVDAAVDMIVRNDRVNNEFYTCPCYNYAIGLGKKIGIYDIKPEHMHGLGTPDDLEIYLSFLKQTQQL